MLANLAPPKAFPVSCLFEFVPQVIVLRLDLSSPDIHTAAVIHIYHLYHAPETCDVINLTSAYEAHPQLTYRVLTTQILQPKLPRQPQSRPRTPEPLFKQAGVQPESG